MKIGVPKESHPGERRVAASPKNVERLIKLGFEVLIEHDAGLSADFPDSAYEAAGASIAPDAATVWSTADVVAKGTVTTLNLEKGGFELMGDAILDRLRTRR